jgi:iron complex transport system ATP-binding protein
VRNVGWRAATVPVLEHVSFDVAAGEFVAVMGRNGAGKSTLLDIVAGLRTPTVGAVMLAGRVPDEMTAIERARMLAHLPQNLRADLSMRTEALVLMGRYAHATTGSSRTRIIGSPRSRCGVVSASSSGGERWRR